MAHAIVRHRLLDLRPVVHHGLALTLGIAILSAAAIALAREGGLTSLDAPIALVIVLVIAGVVFSAPVYPTVRRRLQRYLFSGELDVEQTLVDATGRLTRVMPRERLTAEIVQIVRTAVQPESVTLLVWEPSTERWDVTHREHGGHDHDLEALVVRTWEVDATFASGVRLLEARTDDPRLDAVIGPLRTAGVEVWMGLRRGAATGVLLLGARRIGPAYFAQQLRVLDALAPIVAAALEIDALHRRSLELERARARDAHLAEARAERLENLQRMTQMLAHEISNPLTPIKAFARLLPRRRDDPGFLDDFSRIVAREIERIERLVTRLRRVAPHADPRAFRLDLREPVRHAVEVVEATAASQHTCLEADLGPSMVPVVGDPAELEELFLNLLTNALEAIAEAKSAERCVRVTIDVTDAGAIVRVCDSGPGIPADALDRIFEPFVTTRARGSGLGLAICRGIAERHRGRLAAANAESGGAVFTVTLPLERL